MDQYVTYFSLKIRKKVDTEGGTFKQLGYDYFVLSHSPFVWVNLALPTLNIFLLIDKNTNKNKYAYKCDLP